MYTTLQVMLTMRANNGSTLRAFVSGRVRGITVIAVLLLCIVIKLPYVILFSVVRWTASEVKRSVQALQKHNNCTDLFRQYVGDMAIDAEHGLASYVSTWYLDFDGQLQGFTVRRVR